MTDEEKYQYRRLVNQLWQIYYKYNPAMSSLHSIKNNVSNGVRINNESPDMSVVDDANNSLSEGRSNIYYLISNINNKLY